LTISPYSCTGNKKTKNTAMERRLEQFCQLKVAPMTPVPKVMHVVSKPSSEKAITVPSGSVGAKRHLHSEKVHSSASSVPSK